MSDHFPCFLSYSLHGTKEQGETIVIKRKLTDEAIAKIQQFLLFYDWTPTEYMNASDGYNYLIVAITEALDAYAPKRKIVIRRDDRFREAWLTVRIKKYNQKSRKL